MKSIYLIFLFLIISFSCKDEESNDTYDFSLLGIEKIVVDNTEINTNAFGFPDVSDESITMTGSSDESEKRSYDLVIFNPMPTEETIHVQSKFNDVTVDISRSETSPEYIITVSRNGYHEYIIYRIGFMNLPA